MSDKIIHLHNMIIKFEAIGCWHTANMLREILKEALEAAK